MFKLGKNYWLLDINTYSFVYLVYIQMNKKIIIGVVVGTVLAIIVALVLIFTLPKGGSTPVECDPTKNHGLCSGGRICRANKLCEDCNVTAENDCPDGYTCTKDTHRCVPSVMTREELIKQRGYYEAKLENFDTGETVAVVFQTDDANIPITSPNGDISGIKCFDPFAKRYNLDIGDMYNKLINNPSGAVSIDKKVFFPSDSTQVKWVDYRNAGIKCPIQDILMVPGWMKIYKYINNKKVDEYNTPIYGSQVAYDNFSDNIALYSDVIYISNDSGKTFTNKQGIGGISFPGYTRIVSSGESGDYILAIDDEYYYISYNAGQTWNRVSAKPNSLTGVAMSYTGHYQYIFTGSDKSMSTTILFSNDSGDLFTQIPLDDGVYMIVESQPVVSYDGKELWLSTNKGLAYSNNYGAKGSWKYYDSNAMLNCGNYDGSVLYGNVFSADDKGDKSEIHKSTDKGKTWNKVSTTPLPGNGLILGWCSTFGGSMHISRPSFSSSVSLDGGKTWNSL